MSKQLHKQSAKKRQRTNVHSGKNQLRIIGGKWRGRKLLFPDVEGLRPTGDRVRETLFNWLTPRLQNARCLDVFAGSAALALEALSRDAKEAILIEQHPLAAEAIRANCALLTIENARLYQEDALVWLSQPVQAPFDIIFLDPPFASDLLPRVIDLLCTNGYTSTDTIIYVETDKNQTFDAPMSWQTLKEKQAGQVCFRLYQCI